MSLSLRYLSARYRIHGALEVSTTLVFDLRGKRGGGGRATWGRGGRSQGAVSGRSLGPCRAGELRSSPPRQVRFTPVC